MNIKPIFKKVSDLFIPVDKLNTIKENESLNLPKMNNFVNSLTAKIAAAMKKKLETKLKIMTK